MIQNFEHESLIQAPAKAVFAFHERPDALSLLIPPGQPIKILEHTGGIRDGAKVVLEMGYWPFTLRWVARHQGYIEGKQFQDVQERGPFRSWVHTHTVIPVTATSCRLVDHIEIESILAPFVKWKLKSIFLYRHRVTAERVTQL